MRNLYKKFDDLVFHFEGAILFLTLTSLVAILSLQVLFRFFLNQPLDFTEEIARLLFAWLIFIGAARAMRVSQHFVVDVVYLALPSKLRNPIGYLVDAVTIGFLAMLFWIGLTASIKGAGQILPVMQISASAQTSALPVGMVLMLIHAIGFPLRRAHVGDREFDSFAEEGAA
ncbi:TRAP transporter small permease [Antarctobacter heliothermus]|uniref:TRAP transporter small permease protein n=1 Tax=Antarctobacter heliothermus TaxID=74033 RepID=A0A239KY51_9RHOB|nr:TRAP transporter small permease [Antarctobacter heliothermus]SNT23287.1 TRAP-type C4-dicarboxylate transport system, small permease component [Antarctobacter heliothermus]